MKQTFTLLIVTLFPLIGIAQTRPKEQVPDLALAFTHVTVLDMRGGPARRNMTVVVSGNRVASVQNSKTANLPKGIKVVDAKGKFLLPGFWDMHVHIRETEPITFPLFIANGVTGIREMHYPGKCSSIGKWKDSVSTDDLPAPRIGAAAGCILDGPGNSLPWGFTVVNSEEEARREVRSLKQSGADFIKVYSLLPLPVYQAIVDEAKKQGIPFAGHIPLSVPAITCSELGQKSFEHMGDFHRYFSSEETAIVKAYADSLSTLTNALHRRLFNRAYETYTPQKVSALAEVLKKNGTYVCPTLINSQISYKRSYLSQEGKERLKAVPVAVNQKWTPKMATPMPEKDSLFLAKVYERELEIIRLLHQAGVRLMTGTDASPLRYVIPGFSLHDELRLLVQAGLTPYEALKTATSNPAVFLNRGHELGTVEEGKLADLLLLDANPLEDITNTRKITAVVANGRYYSKQALNQLLQSAEVAAKK